MKLNTKCKFAFASKALMIFAALFGFAVCGHAQVPVPLHDNIRTMPYPRMEHELYLNPPPFLVPKAIQKSDKIQFEISGNENFNTKEVIQSKVVSWSMFSPHKSLEPGVWYWRYRLIGKIGIQKEWSSPRMFTVKESTPTFATPPFEKLLAGIPKTYPRLYLFLSDGLSYARKNANMNPEYKEMNRRAELALKLDYTSIKNVSSRFIALSNSLEFLHQAYMITGLKVYSDKMLEMGRYMLSLSDDKALENDFVGGDYSIQLLNIYDVLYSQLTDAERKGIESAVIKFVESFYRGCIGVEENHIYDNHFWQHTIRVMFQAGLMLHDKYPIAQEILEYSYELWSTRAPGGGFIMDGNWNYGTGYFDVDAYTVYYMTEVLTYFTGFRFMQHPWFQNVGKALCYIWPPNSMSPGFGDGHERESQPSRIRLGFADYIARETGNPYAAWYVNECQTNAKKGGRLTDDYLFRLYRFARMNKTYSSFGLPKDSPKMMWFKDCGEVEAHSDISNPGNNLFLSFRSSPYGSGSHTLADQNSFNLHYKGVPVYRSTGHYWHFSDAHNLLSYRHTRAHNALLIDGMGQPFSSKAYGNVVRALDGKNISYCLGDASNAYCGISEYPMWQENFKKEGIEQSRENGFGDTPLKLYRRHILLLHPDKVVIYDELEASKAVRWDWLLHSPVQFDINDNERKLTTLYDKDGFQSVAQLFCNKEVVFSQTNKYVADPDQEKNKRNIVVSPAWHLTASFGPSVKNRILTIIQIVPTEESPLVVTQQSEGNLICGDWQISAELNVDKQPRLEIQNKKRDVVFSFGDDSPVIKGKVYSRKQSGSSVLYDRIDGKKQVLEMSDCPARPTR